MDVFAVIADPTRRTMLEMMVTGERAAGDFVAAFPQMSQPAISQHLKVLRDAGMVCVRAERQKRFYALNGSGLDTVRDWLSRFSVPEAPEPAKPRAKVAARSRAPSPPKPVTLDLFG